MNISFDSTPEGTLIVVRGPLGVGTATEFSMIVSQLLDVAGEHTVVDLTAVETQDAAGRAALRCVQRRMTEFGGLLRIPAEVRLPEEPLTSQERVTLPEPSVPTESPG